jgi:hypothetical protein
VVCSTSHLNNLFSRPTGTGYKVFVNRSLGSQNMPARASKWLKKNLHLLELRLRLLSIKRSYFFYHPCRQRSHTSSCAPAHYASFSLIISKSPESTTRLRSQPNPIPRPLRLVLIAARLLVLLHNARSILTRGYSCPLKPQ